MRRTDLGEMAYIKGIDKYETIEIIIGTDGLTYSIPRNKRVVKLLSAICLRKIGKGTHVIKRFESHLFNRFVPTNEKLLLEVNKTFELVMYLKSIGINPIVHLDLNTNKKFGSYSVYENVKGWFEGLNCKVLYKPDSYCASIVADFFL